MHAIDNQPSTDIFNILIVDDNPQNIQVLGSLLRKEGYNLEFATNGENALKWVDEENFDLILLDIMMPGMSGFEVCEKIKQNKFKYEIPIIFLSAKTDLDSLVKGFEIGGVDYITKPFNSLELLCRIQTHLELQWRRKELKRANAEKDKFYSIVAHDIKNPFTYLTTSLELIEQVFDKLDKDRLKEKFLKMKKEIESVVTTSENLLQWAHLQSKKINYSPKKIVVANAIREVVDFYSVVAIQKKINILLEIPKEMQVVFDPEHFGIVIRNLLSNAIKFSNSGSDILISSENKDDRVYLSVKDSGIGMATDVLGQLFDISIKNTRTGTANEKGTGLGLLLIKEFVEINRGKLEIDSTEGKGSTFVVQIPTKTN